VSKREWFTRGSILIALLALLAVVGVMLTRPGDVGCDPTCERIRGELRSFTNWLAKHDAQGYIGEVGWPDTQRWNAIADHWYDDADAAGLPVTAWAVGDRWPASYPLTIYGKGRANGQARVVEAHPSTDAYKRGVNVAGAEFGLPAIEPTSAPNAEYGYPDASTFRFLASRGVKIARLPFRWERIQPNLGADLDTGELGRLTSTVDAAHRAGLEVVLDMHNYAGYYLGDRRRSLGSDDLTAEHFVDVWRRLSEALRDNDGIFSYGLMNEPVGIPDGARSWETMSRAVVRAIRDNDDHKTIMVAGYEWSGVQSFAEQHARPWIPSSLGEIRYEAHHYFDEDHSGTYD
jgi:hypothetical protein